MQIHNVHISNNNQYYRVEQIESGSIVGYSFSPSDFQGFLYNSDTNLANIDRHSYMDGIEDSLLKLVELLNSISKLHRSLIL